MLALAMLATLLILAQAQLILPVNTAYHLGRGELMWGGYLANKGELKLDLNTTGGPFHIEVRGPKMRKALNQPFPSIQVQNPGWYRFTLSGRGATEFLRLSGPAAAGAKFNLKPRLNAASVHLRYPLPEDAQVAWFYNEVKAVTDPVSTFYMACGFKRGYFGMQVNGPKERRIIFSVWDSGTEAVDRTKVAAKDRVRLLGKGDGVVASDFGNEGTGGHSHLVIPWRTDTRQRFLLHAVMDGDATVYTAYYFVPGADWKLIASFRAPQDGGLLTNLSSFNENFWGDNGHLKRAAEFGPVWVRTEKGPWMQLTTARFTHDATGGKDRFDYDLTTKRGRWLLQNGGFEGRSPEKGTEVKVRKSWDPPQIRLESLRRR